MKRIVLPPGNSIIGQRIGEDVVIVMDWDTKVVKCHFEGKVVIDCTEDIKNAMGAWEEWAVFPTVVGNTFKKGLEIKDKCKVTLVQNYIQSSVRLGSNTLVTGDQGMRGRNRWSNPGA